VAEATAVEGKPQEAASKRGKGRLFAVVAVLVLLGAGAAGAYWAFGRTAAGKSAHAAAGPEEASASHAGSSDRTASRNKGVLALEPFVANLADPEGDRFIKCTVRLVIEGEEAAQAVRENDLALTRIRDKILTLVSSKTFAEVSTVEGKERLREQIQEQVSPIVEAGKVTEVYYTEFIVQ
jgi:flagellar FliL protein